MERFKNSVVFIFVGLMVLSLSGAGCTLNQEIAPAVEQPLLPTPEELATPASLQPAAGICGAFEGDYVTVTIYPDIPDPRCVKVEADQKLIVANQRGEPIQVRFGHLEAQITPGEETLFDLPFGEYLAPGVHRLMVSPCCGGEIILDGS